MNSTVQDTQKADRWTGKYRRKMFRGTNRIANKRNHKWRETSNNNEFGELKEEKKKFVRRFLSVLAHRIEFATSEYATSAERREREKERETNDPDGKIFLCAHGARNRVPRERKFGAELTIVFARIRPDTYQVGHTKPREWWSVKRRKSFLLFYCLSLFACFILIYVVDGRHCWRRIKKWASQAENSLSHLRFNRCCYAKRNIKQNHRLIFNLDFVKNVW